MSKNKLTELCNPTNSLFTCKYIIVNLSLLLLKITLIKLMLI